MSSSKRARRARSENKMNRLRNKEGKVDRAARRQEEIWQRWRDCSLCFGEGRVVIDQGDHRSALAPCPNSCGKAPKI